MRRFMDYRTMPDPQGAVLQQAFSPTITVPVKVAASAAGFDVQATIMVQPQGGARRLAKRGEVSITIWRQDWLHWSITSGPWTLESDDGTVYWPTYTYEDSVWRFTVKHLESGAEVDHIFRVAGGQIYDLQDGEGKTVKENIMNAGKEMPAGWS